MNVNTVGNRCVGCGACSNICPVGAITMKVSKDGFLYPTIDSDKCINCGLCASGCPALFSSFKPKTFQPICYAAYSDDDNALRSSSGGMFGIVASDILNNGGYVCGAAFDKDWSVKHIIISDVADLDKLRVSKYVQSDTNNVYGKIKDLLDAGNKVLFSGTPCQIAGLYGFLRKDYDNLLTCEVFCHGAPSPMVWKRYIKEVSDGRKITAINFRDKEKALNNKSCPYNVTFYFDNGQCLTKPYIEYSYMKGFLRNLYLRKSCATCKFAKTQRASDLSFGDFWGYNKIDKRRNVKKGISADLVNTEKGKAIFDSVRKNLSFIRPVRFSDIVSGNPVLVKALPAHKNRTMFFDDFNNSKDKASDIIMRNLENRDVAIMNFASRTDNNYGASLVGYAMEQAIKSAGYTPYTIAFMPAKEIYRKSNHHVFWRFQRNFLNVTGICASKEDLYEHINDRFDKFVIGSDQIIRHPWHYNFAYYLDWVHGNKSLLAYAPSFGRSKLGMGLFSKHLARKYLLRFDALSVREHSGAEIMEKEFGIKDVPVVCDPTMLLTAQDYQPIIDATPNVQKDKEYVAYYLLDASPDVLSELGKKYQLIDAYRDDNGDFREIGQWLDIIKNAKYVVTDSFHGTVFSMLFKRQFITLTTRGRGNERIDTLMKLVGVNRLVDAKTLITEQDHFASKLDYAVIDENISAARRFGFDFLKNALLIKPNQKRKVMRKKVFKLFDFIPLFSIKNNKCYIFGKVEIGKIKE